MKRYNLLIRSIDIIEEMPGIWNGSKDFFLLRVKEMSYHGYDNVCMVLLF